MNSNKKLPFINFYILTTMFFQLIGQAFKIQPLRMLKPFPIIMMIYYIWYQNTNNNRMQKLIMTGLCFSLIGDLLLMMDGITTFLVGSLFFMITHIIYVAAFMIGQKVKEMRGRFKILRIMGYIVIWIALVASISSLW